MDIAGVREQVEDGVTGFVVPPGDPQALADALEELLADPELRTHMGLAGRERVQRLFSTDAYVSRVVQVYQLCYSAKARRKRWVRMDREKGKNHAAE